VRKTRIGLLWRFFKCDSDGLRHKGEEEGNHLEGEGEGGKGWKGFQ
jgi:hypothetical protein